VTLRGHSRNDPGVGFQAESFQQIQRLGPSETIASLLNPTGCQHALLGSLANKENVAPEWRRKSFPRH
jgi:hypothetical protein